MEISKKQAEFWAFIIIMCTVAAIAILLVDFGIKTAILEESNKLRLVIEEEEVRRNGRKHAGTNASGSPNDANNDAPVPGDVLVDDTTGMETGYVSNGNTETSGPASAANRRTKPSRQTNPRAIPARSE